MLLALTGVNVSTEVVQHLETLRRRLLKTLVAAIVFYPQGDQAHTAASPRSPFHLSHLMRCNQKILIPLSLLLLTTEDSPVTTEDSPETVDESGSHDGIAEEAAVVSAAAESVRAVESTLVNLAAC